MVYTASAPDNGLAKKVTIQTLRKMKTQREKFVTVSLYRSISIAISGRRRSEGSKSYWI